MKLSNLSSGEITALISLVKKKETLVEELAKIDAQLAKYDSVKLGSKTKAGGRIHRGDLKDGIVKALNASGKEGLSVKELASHLGTKSNNIFSFFYTTGKKSGLFKKVGTARYALK
jgi:hypothetical protein